MENTSKDLFSIVNSSADIPDNYKYYWGYQWRLGLEVVVPYIIDLGCFKPGDSVAEIGSAEGGVLAAFVSHGAQDALATDIVQGRLDMGRKIADMAGLPIEFTSHDILAEEIPDKWVQKFDLVILRDVIEHLDFTEDALRNIKRIVKPGGYLIVTFPPYHSPFGGHQHTVLNIGGRLPYIHLLPDFIFHRLIASGRPGDIGEVKRLQKIRLTPKKFVTAARLAGWNVYHEDYYLLRPVFKMKFGLPSLKMTGLAKMNFIKQYMSMEASFVLQA